MHLPWRRKSLNSDQDPSGGSNDRALRLRRLFDQTNDLAWRMLRRFGVPADRVEDCFQQLYLIASTRLDDIRPGRERSFVYGIALRLARSNGRRTWREVPDAEPDRWASTQLGAEALLERRRLVELCDRILDQLKPDVREVFVLYELEGLSGAEIAKLLDIPEGTAHSRLRRARLIVRELVAALGNVGTEARGG